jgi:hypothetical protein
MKTAVSIPDDVFEGGERLARQTKNRAVSCTGMRYVSISPGMHRKK